ncbi:MAG TPA: hypothetical protein VGM21_11800 [Actinomycetota bacterium]
MSAPLWPGRPCGLCGNPAPERALLEAHVGPTRRYPWADVVVWLCVACAVDVTARPADDPECQGDRR